MTTIDVTIPGDSYSVHVASGAIDQLGTIVRDVAPHGRALLAVDHAIIDTHGKRAGASLAAAGYDPVVVPIVATESHKTLAAVETLYRVMADAGLERRSPVVAVGGGLTGDVAGFAAATFLRGVPLVQVPTTLLAMVDASIGGKTGVNWPVADGAPAKNLIGAFWQPRAVVSDPDVLRTLSPRDFRCGLAESIKHGLIAAPDLLEFLETSAGGIERLESGTLADLVTRSARVKIDIVEADVREAGRRALLNLGHTFAHAAEPLPELDLRHGEAVAIGLCAAMHAAVRTGRMTDDRATRIAQLIDRLGLPTRLAADVEADRLVGRMRFDKKVQDGRLRLVLPTSDGTAEIVEGVPVAVVRAAWLHVGASDGAPLS